MFKWTKKKIMEKTLPVLGSITNLVAAVSGSISTLFALKVMFNKNNASFLRSSYGYGGAFIRLSMFVIMYQFSKANTYLASMGKSIDNFFCRTHNDNLTPSEVVPGEKIKFSSSTALILTKIALPALVIADICVQSSTLYEQILAVGNEMQNVTEYRAVGNEIQNSSGLIFEVLAITTAVSSGLANLIFEGSFAIDLYAIISKKLTKFQMNNSNTEAEIPEGTINHADEETRLVKSYI